MVTMYSQYRQMKEAHQDAILLFRLGDFYETFEDDAALASRILNITLTSRSMGKGLSVPMAGIPVHTLENYLGKLLQAGYKVALCEQVSEPGNGLVDREVVQLLTPGMSPEFSLQSEDMNSYIAVLVREGVQIGIAYGDVSTGEFAATQLEEGEFLSEIQRINPIEIVIDEAENTSEIPGSHVVKLSSGVFQRSVAYDALMQHFGIKSLQPYGIDRQPLGVTAAGVLIQYVNTIDKRRSSSLKSLRSYNSGQTMRIDHQTRKNLELFDDRFSRQDKFSLYGILNQTYTPMGARLLRSWIGSPDRNIDRIQSRLDCVETFCCDQERRQSLRSALQGIRDLERLLNRLSTTFVTPVHLINLKDGLKRIPQIKRQLEGIGVAHVQELNSNLDPCLEVTEIIDESIVQDDPSSAGSGNAIKQGFSEDLDRLKQGLQDARIFIEQIETAERERTGIKSLKVRYNKVFGYFIEVTSSHVQHVPDNYIRRQTLVNSERFVTDELKRHESVVLEAASEIERLETEIFETIRAAVIRHSEQIINTAKAIGEVDAIVSLAEVAVRNSYVRPTLSDQREIRLVNSRHPLVESTVLKGNFVGNDLDLDAAVQQLAIVTGPNMSGKSTFIRQVAVIVLMAQIGSFVPADSAVLGIVDAIFTRVGLHDDLALGQSTFMVEMIETASILNSATSNSLIVLDEIGRGTSTYDGLAIAQAVAEYIHEASHLGAITLFATHYHEMTTLAQRLRRVVNLCVAVVEENEEVVFLHKIKPGAADRSYGVNVAQLAGIPDLVIERAKWLLRELEAEGQRENLQAMQGTLFDINQSDDAIAKSVKVSDEVIVLDDIKEQIMSLDVDTMQPIEALNFLHSLNMKLHSAVNKSYERADL